MMDSIDKALLTLLQRDASRSNVELAAEVGLTPSSCLRRVQRLRKSGWIDRIVAIVNPEVCEQALRAIVTIKLKTRDKEKSIALLRDVIAEELVSNAYEVSGDVDIVFMLRIRDKSEYFAVRDRILRSHPIISAVEEMFVIETAKKTSCITL